MPNDQSFATDCSRSASVSSNAGGVPGPHLDDQHALGGRRLGVRQVDALERRRLRASRIRRAGGSPGSRRRRATASAASRRAPRAPFSPPDRDPSATVLLIGSASPNTSRANCSLTTTGDVRRAVVAAIEPAAARQRDAVDLVAIVRGGIHRVVDLAAVHLVVARPARVRIRRGEPAADRFHFRQIAHRVEQLAHGGHLRRAHGLVLVASPSRRCGCPRRDRSRSRAAAR